MALATNDIDAVEMAAGEAMLAGFDGTLTLVLVVATMSLGVDWRLAAFALLPFPLMALAFWWISRHVHEASRAVAGALRRAQRPRAGNAGRRAHGARAGPAGAQRAAVPAAGRRRRRVQPAGAALGSRLRAGGGLHASPPDGAGAGRRRLAGVARRS
jgi:ABC-type multidrug transport system fused ATPase/permease subunit